MNRNRFLLLVAVTLVAVVLVALLGRSGTDGSAHVPEALLPGLTDSVNELAALDIVAPGGETAVRLRRDEERWRVQEKDGYEAEFAQVLDLLRTLADADVAEPRTDREEWYGRLGVQDVAEPDATGRRIDFPGTDLPSVIIGQRDPSGEGSYARRAGEARSWLLDEIVEVPVDPVAWVEPGIMDIPSEDIAEVVVRHADGETVRLQRVGEGGDATFVLRDVPEGREAGEAWKRNALANGLRGLNLEDVQRFEPPPPEDAVQVTFETADGLRFDADVFRRDERHWVHFTVSAVEPAGGTESSPEADPADAEGEADAGARTADGERLADAVAVDARLSPWLFEITERRFDDLTPRMEDLLAEPEGTEADADSG